MAKNNSTFVMNIPLPVKIKLFKKGQVRHRSSLRWKMPCTKSFKKTERCLVKPRLKITWSRRIHSLPLLAMKEVWKAMTSSSSKTKDQSSVQMDLVKQRIRVGNKSSLR